MATNLYTVDNLGNLYAPNGQAVGTYDGITQKCELYDSTEVTCPQMDQVPFEQLTVKDKPTYWWVVLLLFVFAVLFWAWYNN